MEKIRAFIVNRNLLTTLRNTVEFLNKESRVEVFVYDQQSTYEPLLEYYKDSGVNVIYSKENAGPNSVWGETVQPYFNNSHFIVADSDCLYNGVPSDWLDKMLEVLDKTSIHKVGFSLEIDDLPDTEVGRQAADWERKFWVNRSEFGWNAHIDTTFALYRPYFGFSYSAIRLDKPYCIKHMPWYLTKDNITDEWRYYLENASHISTWGNKLKETL